MRRARGQLKGPAAIATIAALVALAACGGSADAVPAEAPPAPGVPGTAAVGAATPGTATTGTATSAAPGSITEATCTTAPLGVRVVAVRRESADSIRVELTLANLAPAGAWTPGSPAATAIQGAVEALEGASVLSADGRRRMFALRDSLGQRV
ncbi:MAG: hypothetical protein ABIT71_25760, partial [Vicinamibacteraceae bacterium]